MPEPAAAADVAPLRISETFALPARAQTETFAFLAVRGAGKTHNASVLAEEFARAGLPFVVLDPVGVWWGLRSSDDGQRPGFPVTVLGGDHGDLPLEVGAGDVVADLVVEQRVSLILDLSLFGEGQMSRFVAAFLARLYLRNREPLHVFVDEADEFAPQQPYGDQAAMLGAMQRVIRRGRARGIGATLISQRAADVNKRVLGQCEVLVAMRTVGARDVEAIEDWIEKHADAAQAAELVKSLPRLDTGEAWICSAFWLRAFQRVTFRRRETFDSSRTPEPGERPRVAKVLAPVDLDALRARIAATIDAPKADDAKALRARVRELEELLAAKTTAAAVEPLRVEVPVVGDEELRRVEDLVGRATAAAETWRAAAQAVTDEAGRLGAAVRAAIAPEISADESRRAGAAQLREHVGQAVPALRRAAAPIAAASSSDDPGPRSGPEQRILDALAELEVLGVDRPARIQVALLAGYTHLASKGFANATGALRTAGRIEYVGDGSCALTAAGRAAARRPKRPRTSQEIQTRFLELLGGVHERVLRPLIVAHPGTVAREDLVAAAGYGHAASKGFANALGRLRSLGLVDMRGPGQLAASRLLFLTT